MDHSFVIVAVFLHINSCSQQISKSHMTNSSLVLPSFSSSTVWNFHQNHTKISFNHHLPHHFTDSTVTLCWPRLFGQALLDSQIAAQKQETEAAMATLREASREMEAIQFEKCPGAKGGRCRGMPPGHPGNAGDLMIWLRLRGIYLYDLWKQGQIFGCFLSERDGSIWLDNFSLDLTSVLGCFGYHWAASP